MHMCHLLCGSWFGPLDLLKWKHFGGPVGFSRFREAKDLPEISIENTGVSKAMLKMIIGENQSFVVLNR